MKLVIKKIAMRKLTFVIQWSKNKFFLLLKFLLTYLKIIQIFLEIFLNSQIFIILYFYTIFIHSFFNKSQDRLCILKGKSVWHNFSNIQRLNKSWKYWWTHDLKAVELWGEENRMRIPLFRSHRDKGISKVCLWILSNHTIKA